MAANVEKYSRDEYHGERGAGFFDPTNTCDSQVGTHVDSLIAESMLKGVRGFNEQLAFEAVHKDATV
jgi:hypothetical protein